MTGRNPEAHKSYLSDFGAIFYEKVKALIDKNARKTTLLQKLEAHEQNLFNEVTAHAKLSAGYALKFHGRVEILNKVNLFLQNILRSDYVFLITSTNFSKSHWIFHTP